MKWITILVLFIVIALTVLAAVPFSSGNAEDQASPIFGIKIPAGYREWKLMSVAHEEGTLNDLRAILGNDIAIKAAQDGKLPYADDTIIARLAWNYDPLAESIHTDHGKRPASAGATSRPSSISIRASSRKARNSLSRRGSPLQTRCSARWRRPRASPPWFAGWGGRSFTQSTKGTKGTKEAEEVRRTASADEF